MPIEETSPSLPAASLALGISGYTFADLHEPERLSSLYDRFCEEVSAENEALWAEWDEYRRNPDAARPPVALSNLIVAMAPYVSRFVTRLFDVGGPGDAVVERTRAQDDLFRFKVDFVRRRVLPLLKSAVPVVSAEADEETIRRLLSGSGEPDGGDLELSIARLGCALLDREKTEKEATAASLDALKRWCAARIHDPAYARWVIFRFPENVDYWHLVDSTRPFPELPEAMYGPERRLRRRDGFKLTDARWREREVLSEIHYCVLCHERDKDSCSKGLHQPAKGSPDKPAPIAVNPLGIALEGCPLDEKISEMHTLRRAGDALGALAVVAIE